LLKQGTGWFEGQHTYAVGPKRVNRVVHRNDPLDEGFRRWSRGSVDQIGEDSHPPGAGSSNRLQTVEPPVAHHVGTTSQKGGIPSGSKAVTDRFRPNGRRGLSPEPGGLKSFTLKEEEFPALGTAGPKAQTASPQLGSPNSLAGPDGGLNSIR